MRPELTSSTSVFFVDYWHYVERFSIKNYEFCNRRFLLLESKFIKVVMWKCSLSPGCLFLPNSVNISYALGPHKLSKSFSTQSKNEAPLPNYPISTGFSKKRSDNWWKHNHETGSVLQCLTDTKVSPPWSYNQDQTKRRAKYLLMGRHSQKSRYFTTLFSWPIRMQSK